MQLVVRHADITESDTDAIVNPVGSTLGMTSSVAKAVRLHCGGPVKSDLQRYESLAAGTVAVTQGYNLAEYLVHAATTPGENSRGQNVRSATREALKTADNLGCRTLAIPVLGTGAGNLPYQAGVKIIGEAVDAYDPDYLTETRIVCKTREKAEAAAELVDQDDPWVERTL
jgi:O-acetyl-ADP-ribose deacetylase (regulator of RNase III)